MTTHNIAVIGGDGIGPEVTAEAVKVIRAAGVEFDTTDFDLGGQRYLRDGEVLSDATLDELRSFDAILLGAVGTPEVPPGVIERGLLLKMRDMSSTRGLSSTRISAVACSMVTPGFRRAITARNIRPL